MLFNDTMHYNIAYGDLHASREDVETAARQAFHPPLPSSSSHIPLWKTLLLPSCSPPI